MKRRAVEFRETQKEPVGTQVTNWLATLKQSNVKIVSVNYTTVNAEPYGLKSSALIIIEDYTDEIEEDNRHGKP